MYETAITEEIRQRVDEMGPADLVVGIPSYRNSRTVGQVVERVAAALDSHYAHLRPVIVHADGHSFDDTLSVASHVALPPSVRRVATRYQGLPGKGSALRAVFEIATTLRARAILIVEADVISFDESWVPALVEPVLARQFDMVLPVYQQVQPPMLSADLIARPLISAMFHIPAQHPLPGEVALSGGVASYFAGRDVWETDVARDGVDIWMTVEVVMGDGHLGQVHVGPKIHRIQESTNLAEVKFLQEIGTLFRTAILHDKAWLGGAMQPRGIQTLGQARQESVEGDGGFPDPLSMWKSGRRASAPLITTEWTAIMAPAQLHYVRELLALPEDSPAFDERMWARIVYDFVVVYNLGEGDPDKVVTTLYPLFLMRAAALETQILGTGDEPGRYTRAIDRQATIFHEEFDYLLTRWESYVSPDQIEMWRDLGMLPGEEL